MSGLLASHRQARLRKFQILMTRFGKFNILPARFGKFKILPAKFGKFKILAARFGKFKILPAKFGKFNSLPARFGKFKILRYTTASKNTVSVSDISAVNLNPNPNSMFRDSHQNLTAQSTRRPQGALKEGFKFQRRDCKLSLIAAPLESPGELACKLFLSSSVTEFICLCQNEIVHILPYCGPS